jgi:hypothetical protein
VIIVKGERLNRYARGYVGRKFGRKSRGRGEEEEEAEKKKGEDGEEKRAYWSCVTPDVVLYAWC